MVRTLEDMQATALERTDRSSLPPEFLDQMAAYLGQPLDLGDADGAATLVAATRIRGDFVRAFEYFLTLEGLGEDLQAALRDILERVDPSPWRARVLGASGDARALDSIASAVDPSTASIQRLVLLSSLLRSAGSAEGSRRIAQAAWRRDPGEFLAAVECCLASIRIMPYDRAAGVRFATAAVAIRPHSAAAHHLLGYSLWLHDDYSGAIEAYRTAIRRNPGSFASRNNLAISLSALGRFQEAVPAAQELAVVAGRAGRTDEEEAWRRTASEWAALGARIDKVLAGEERAGSARDALVAASLADRKDLHRAATRLMQEALRLEKEPIGLRADLYYEAACSAAQAGAGRGDDDDGDEAERSRYVRLAIELLREDLRVRRASVDARIALTAERRSLLASWIEDEDLAGIRDAVALTRLPEAERKACLDLWTEVTSLIDTLER